VETPSVLELRLNRSGVWSAAGWQVRHPFVKLKDSWLQRPRLLPLPTPYVSSPIPPLGSIHLQRTLPVDKHHGARSC
jgi:hypothetical protein